jgi:arginase
MRATPAWSSRPVQPIGVPLYLGADQHGAELSPTVLDDALRFRLRRWGFDDILARVAPLITVTPPPADPAASRGAFERARHLPAIAAVSADLARVVERTIASGALAVVLGGDHSLSIGSLAGSAAAGGRLAVIWLDAHGDVNTPDTSPSGHIHGMPLAVALGAGDARLTGLLGRPPLARDVYMIGVRELDPGERQFLRARPVHVYTAHTVSQVGIRRILDDIQADLIAKPIDAVHVSFDMDVVDPVTLPGTGAKAFGGLSFREANFALKRLRDSGLPIVAADFVELNPLLDVAGRSVEIAAHLLATFLGEEIL